MNRSSGILMAMSSLPSKYGIGTMGKSAYKFVDFLRDSGQKYWQLLPLCPTSYGDSPYSSFSTFAGNPYFIDLELLVRDKLLKPQEFADIDWGTDETRVDYGKIYQHRFDVLRIAYRRGKECCSAEIEEFRRGNAWVENYALFMALKSHFGMVSWTQWPEDDIRRHEPAAVERYRAELADEVNFHVFMQFLFFRQWNALRSYAHEQGVQFIGDLPIYVALDSADVWSESRFFQLDEDNVPTELAGVPPDNFTADGQLWGNPLYDWDAMRADGFGWWIRRIDGARKLYDVIRIDHFRGFESYWAVPYGASTAMNGRWRPGPGMELVGKLQSWFPDLRLIAEDLGYTTAEVRKLLDDSGLPGMKILMFAFDSHRDYIYLPHLCEKNSVCYIGTHDNDTVNGWLRGLDRRERDFARSYMHITEDEGWCWGLIRTGMSTVSDLFVVQMQDVLELGGECRMNVPGTQTGNWQWRMRPGAINKALSKKLRKLTETYGRA